MSNTLTTGGGALPPAPARMQQQRAQGLSVNKAFQEGVRDSFPVISFKGSRWAFRFQGQTSHYLDGQGHPIPYLDVVLAVASPHLGRVFYAKGYAEGDISQPDCWSADGVRPDPTVAMKQSVTCLNCPQNVFGSKVTPAGKQIKACATSRRVVALLPHDLFATTQIGPMLLRVPYSSLQNLKEYSAFLEGNGYDINGCVTRMTFDHTESFPKIKFTFLQPLSDQEYDQTLAMSDDERVDRILSAPVEESHDEVIDGQVQKGVQQAAVPAATFTPPPPPTPAPPPPPTPSPTPAPQAAPPPTPTPSPSPTPPPPVYVHPQAPQMAQGGLPGFAPPPQGYAPPVPPAASAGPPAGNVVQHPSAAQFAAPTQQHPTTSPMQLGGGPVIQGVVIPPGAPAPTPAPPRRGRRATGATPPTATSAAPTPAPPPPSTPAPTTPPPTPPALTTPPTPTNGGVQPAPPGLDSILAAMMPRV